jgi:ubiquinone/menaquinone biosynthesis C-methylase UbiE
VRAKAVAPTLTIPALWLAAILAPLACVAAEAPVALPREDQAQARGEAPAREHAPTGEQVPATDQAPPAHDHHAKPGERDPHDATARHPFDDVDRWVKVFDDPARDEWQKPREVVQALGLRPGMIAADLGAGTGYFTRHLAKAVAPDGFVLAIDTEPAMVKHLGERASKERIWNAVPVLAATDNPFLPPRRVDLVLIVDTYHHIDDRLNYFERLKGSLAPWGRVAIIDFHKRPLPVGPSIEHKLAREFVVEEMSEGGWALVDEKTFLPHQYFLIFAPAAR